MSVSSPVVAGTNATAAEYNNVRIDAITQFRRFYFEIKGTLIVGNAQATITIPASMTVTKITAKVNSGSATVRVQANGTDVLAGISVTTSYIDNSSITNPAITIKTDLTIDITGVSSADTLRVLVYATEII